MITIKATPEVVRMATLAMEIQDACNPRPVASEMVMVIDHFNNFNRDNGQESGWTDISIRNPVTLAFLNKLNHLAGQFQDRTECFTACIDLSKGNDVEWDIREGKYEI